MLNPTQWQTITFLTAWLDRENGRSQHEITLRLMKITEEAGEVASAYVGMTGQNPRKGITHTVEDVQGEVCDVILAALVALASLTDDPAGVLAAKLRKVADRAAALAAPAPACTAALLPPNSGLVDRCVVRGPHDDHRTAAGARWTDADSGVR